MKTHETTVADMVGAYPVCRACGSRKIVLAAWAAWNFATGEWALDKLAGQNVCQACAAEDCLQWQLDEEFRRQRIRRLNDAMRRGEIAHGSVVATLGVQALGDDALPGISAQVATYEDFSEDNDPHGEHDFGTFTHEGDKLFWKIDYFDRALKMHSPDAANPEVTHRVLTIMLASEY